MAHDWQPLERGFRCTCCKAWSLNGLAKGDCDCRDGASSIVESPITTVVPVNVLDSFDVAAEQAGPVVVEAWGIAKQASSLAREASKWAREGFPLRTEQQQLEVIAICRECPMRRERDDALACSICGCKLADNAYRDHGLKIKWATTHCPDSPARW